MFELKNDNYNASDYSYTPKYTHIKLKLTLMNFQLNRLFFDDYNI